MCRTQLGTDHTPYPCRGSSSSNQERRSIWFNPAVTNTTNYSLFIYSNPATTTTIIILHPFFIIVTVTITATLVYYYYLHRSRCCGRYYYNYSTCTSFRSILYSSWGWLVEVVGWVVGWNGMECVWWNDNIIIIAIEQYPPRHSNVSQSIWFNPAVTNTNHS